VRLNDEERAMLAGQHGAAVKRALEMQIEVGEFFGAGELVPVTSAHMMAEIESMGEAGLAFVEEMADLGAQVRVPTTCNPRSVDFALWRELGQDERQVELETRLSAALARCGVFVVDTCINYQTFLPPRFGEHLAWGDTGTVIYANSVAGARSNFEGGPVALASGITGRTAKYGYHLPEQRLGTALVEVRDPPRSRADWSALGCAIGRQVNDYWQVPVLEFPLPLGEGQVEGVDPMPSPTVEDLKHLGAALASHGSLAQFHLVGVTPEARTVDEALGGRAPRRRLTIEPGDLRRTYEYYVPEKQTPDLIVFSAPQLSLPELRDLARALAGRKVHPDVRLIATTNYANCGLAEKLGYLESIRSAGGTVLSGVCFYLVTPRELREKHGWRTIVTDSSKLANIIAGYDYNPVFRPTDVCIEAALQGKLPW
jgi:predicted aconitase